MLFWAVALGVLAGAAQAAAFDARRPGDVAGLVTEHGASGSMKTGDAGKAYFAGQAGQLNFSIHFQDCDAARANCSTLLFSGWWKTKQITPQTLNRWNRWTVYCPAFIDTDGTPEIWYSYPVSALTAADDVVRVQNTWTNCLTDFDSFVGDPEGFLKRVGESDSASASAPVAPSSPDTH
jgi:hypothetical protein